MSLVRNSECTSIRRFLLKGAPMETMIGCPTHGGTFIHQTKISECPGCVLAERDRFRKALEKIQHFGYSNGGPCTDPACDAYDALNP